MSTQKNITMEQPFENFLRALWGSPAPQRKNSTMDQPFENFLRTLWGRPATPGTSSKTRDNVAGT